MRSFAWMLLASCALVGAQPVLDARGEDPTNPESWYRPTRKYYRSVGRRLAKIRDVESLPKCNVDAIVMPTAPTPLPAPGQGLKVSHVSLGRGTQNYTCADSTEATKPVAIGAVAKLYNVTCIAASSPASVALLPRSALEYDLPTKDGEMQPARALFAGDHYFVGPTPRFEVGTKRRFYGTADCKKDAASPAPSDAPLGQDGQGFGSVPWLKLVDAGTSNGFKEVYRIHTAGGNPPPTCKDQPASFEIQYATLYYLLA